MNEEFTLARARACINQLAGLTIEEAVAALGLARAILDEQTAATPTDPSFRCIAERNLAD